MRMSLQQLKPRLESPPTGHRMLGDGCKKSRTDCTCILDGNLSGCASACTQRLSGVARSTCLFHGGSAAVSVMSAGQDPYFIMHSTVQLELSALPIQLAFSAVNVQASLLAPLQTSISTVAGSELLRYISLWFKLLVRYISLNQTSLCF